ncbi:ABC transporter B family member 1 [Senna tora]|uniref:ABC transporter B family member 1 n=1 Tax=Senna tora TaxID=362788 RepID=A0A834TDV0_9FABA|nr:ABC transporter B family member 1 [Senna tora]
MATFVSGFVVGFTAVWQLALVTLVVVPMIAVIGGIHTTTLAKLSGKSQEALSQAGNTVEQTVAQIRVVLAFLGENSALQAYSSALKVAQKIGYKTGLAKGMGLGDGTLKRGTQSDSDGRAALELLDKCPKVGGVGFEVGGGGGSLGCPTQ